MSTRDLKLKKHWERMRKLREREQAEKANLAAEYAELDAQLQTKLSLEQEKPFEETEAEETAQDDAI